MQATEWEPDPNDKALLSKAAPHETAGLMRIHRTGRPAQEIAKMFKLRGHRLVAALKNTLDEEQAAYEQGRPIYDALMPKGAE